jgi:hypothetical protein
MPPKKKALPLHVSLFRIEEERKNVVRRTRTRIAHLQATSVPVPVPIYNDPQEQLQLPLDAAPIPIPIPGYITFPFGLCVGILLSALSFAYLNDCVCSCTCS